MFNKVLFDSIIGQSYPDIIAKFPDYTVYRYENVAEIELNEGTLTCYFDERGCYQWFFYTHNEELQDYHSSPFADVFPAFIYPVLSSDFWRVGLS